MTAKPAVDARCFYMRSRVLLRVVAVVVALLIVLLLVHSCGREKTPEPTASPVSPATAAPSQGPDGQETVPPEKTPDAQQSLRPEPPSVTGDSDATPQPDSSDAPVVFFPGSAVPETEAADDEWFSDAAFLGNSLVDGFRLFSGLTTCDVYAATSMTVMGADSLIQEMAAKQYGKVYILLGINEIGYEADYFKEQYAAMLDKIIEQQPDADIYIMSLTPVSEYKSSTDSTFTMERVNLYNEKLLELAEEKGCYYIDLVDALADDNGYLPASVTTDGIHFSASHYQVWLDYLRTHHA